MNLKVRDHSRIGPGCSCPVAVSMGFMTECGSLACVLAARVNPSEKRWALLTSSICDRVTSNESEGQASMGQRPFEDRPWLFMPNSREHVFYDGMWQPGMCVGSTREPI